MIKKLLYNKKIQNLLYDLIYVKIQKEQCEYIASIAANKHNFVLK